MRSGKFGKGGFGGKQTKAVQPAMSAEAETTVIYDVVAATSDLSGSGTSDVSTQSVTVAYSDEAIAELLFMIEEEKLAGDIYDAFYDMYGKRVFSNIGASEDQHYDALVNQAEQIGVDIDEIELLPAGSFVNEDLQEMYDTLLAQGSTSVTAALEVGASIETKDIVDIAAAAELVEGTALASVYENLIIGSENHLAAFDALL